MFKNVGIVSVKKRIFIVDCTMFGGFLSVKEKISKDRENHEVDKKDLVNSFKNI